MSHLPHDTKTHLELSRILEPLTPHLRCAVSITDLDTTAGIQIGPWITCWVREGWISIAVRGRVESAYPAKHLLRAVGWIEGRLSSERL